MEKQSGSGHQETKADDVINSVPMIQPGCKREEGYKAKPDLLSYEPTGVKQASETQAWA